MMDATRPVETELVHTDAYRARLSAGLAVAGGVARLSITENVTTVMVDLDVPATHRLIRRLLADLLRAGDAFPPFVDLEAIAVDDHA